MKQKIQQLAKEGHTPLQISEMLGCSKGKVYYHLNKDWTNPEPPQRHENPYRQLLADEVYLLVCKERIPYMTAAKLIMARCHPQTLGMASGDPRPVTPRRLANWARPLR